jgi:DNA adenine methylase
MQSYTPLRYPGGKAKLYKQIKNVIDTNFENPPIYVEGYAGGSGLALKLLIKDDVSEIHINDLDYAIYAFWYSILNHKEEFIELINNTEVTVDEWQIQKEIYVNKNSIEYTILKVGFATFFLNRTNRSGILGAGPIGGYSQEGNYKIDCRFNKETLINIINQIGFVKDKIHIYNLDAIEFIKLIDEQYNDTFIYLDPPYVEQGKNLYLNALTEDDHITLKDEVSNLQNKWFITYDNVELIKGIYKDYNKMEFVINYSVANKRKDTELAIYKEDLIVNIDMFELT